MLGLGNALIGAAGGTTWGGEQNCASALGGYGGLGQGQAIANLYHGQFIRGVGIPASPSAEEIARKVLEMQKAEKIAMHNAEIQRDAAEYLKKRDGISRVGLILGITKLPHKKLLLCAA